MKKCSRCNKLKSLKDYHKDKSNKKDGHYSSCKKCVKKYRNKDVQKHYQLNKFYGISLEFYQQMVKEQEDKCFICGADEKKRRKSKYKDSLVVDHEHETGRIRGLLCGFCNSTLLPNLKEDPLIAEKALIYLTRSTSYGYVPTEG